MDDKEPRTIIDEAVIPEKPKAEAKVEMVETMRVKKPLIKETPQLRNAVYDDKGKMIEAEFPFYVIVRKGTNEELVIKINGEVKIGLGREKDCKIYLQNNHMSPKHFRYELRYKKYLVQ